MLLPRCPPSLANCASRAADSREPCPGDLTCGLDCYTLLYALVMNDPSLCRSCSWTTESVQIVSVRHFDNSLHKFHCYETSQLHAPTVSPHLTVNYGRHFLHRPSQSHVVWRFSSYHSRLSLSFWRFLIVIVSYTPNAYFNH